MWQFDVEDALRIAVRFSIALLIGQIKRVLTSGVAQAQLNFSLSPIHIGVNSGKPTTQTYTATLTNHYNYDLSLNGDYFTTDAPLSLDDSKFTNYFILPIDSTGNLLPQPTLAASGGTLTLDIFDLTIPTAPDGTYNGVFGIEHGSQPGDIVDTTAVNFTVEINSTGTASTPEPDALALLVGMGVSGAGFLVRRRSSAL